MPFLISNLSLSHPLWKQRLFTLKIESHNKEMLIDYLRSQVLTGYGHCKSTFMHATGVPTSIALAYEIRELKTAVELMSESNTNLFSGMQENIIKSVENMPCAVKESILENFIVGGVVPLNLRDVQSIVKSSNENILKEVKEYMTQLSYINKDHEVNNSSTNQENIQKSDEPTYFYWGGKMGRLVPEKFIYNSTDVKTAWDTWQHGQGVLWEGKIKHTYPLKRLLLKKHREDLPKEYIVNISRTKIVMKKLENIAKINNLLLETENISFMDKSRSDSIFNASFNILTQTIYAKGPKRPGETILATIANKIYRKNNNEFISVTEADNSG
jgi:hypothetical protein